VMAVFALLNNGTPKSPPVTATPPSCVPVTFAPAPATLLPKPVAKPPRLKDGKPRTVRIVQANMYYRMSASQFASDLSRVVAARPDFVTLNETYRRSLGEIEPSGYSAFRAEGPFDARETPVLWRTDLWKKAESGTYLMHGVSGKFGIRYSNWVVLKARKGGQTVSVISVHASPGPTGRRLLGDYIAALGRLIEPLRTRGPVLIAGDFNINYLSGGRTPLVAGLAGYGAHSTFETLGEPIGGWRTDHGGGTIDYVFVSGASAVAQVVSGLTYSDHRMITASVRLPSVPKLVFSKPGATPTPVVPTGTPTVTC
jgi:endonuclease/exonuclease/phosphatase (EEP) superfamily protein YafD